MKTARLPMIATLAVGSVLAMPMAFAQDAPPGAQAQAPEPTGATSTAQPQGSTGAPQAQGQVTWADLDTDGDSRLSADEAAMFEALSQVFADVDADGDGFVTPEEYRGYASRQGAGTGVPED